MATFFPFPCASVYHVKYHFSAAMNRVMLPGKRIGEEQHHSSITQRIIQTKQQPGINPGENDNQNIDRILSLSIWYQSTDLCHRCMVKHPPTVLSPPHHLLQLFKSPSLQLLSWHHLSHISHIISQIISRLSPHLSSSHRRAFVQAFCQFS